MWFVGARYYLLRAPCNNLSEESTNQAKTDAAGDVPNMTRTENDREKIINAVFNEVQQRAYVLGVRERENLLIQQSIITYSFFKEFPMEIFSGNTIHEGSTLIYSHRVPGF